MNGANRELPLVEYSDLTANSTQDEVCDAINRSRDRRVKADEERREQLIRWEKDYAALEAQLREAEEVRRKCELERSEWITERRKLEQNVRDAETERKKLENKRRTWENDRGEWEKQRNEWEKQRALWEKERQVLEEDRRKLRGEKMKLEEEVRGLKDVSREIPCSPVPVLDKLPQAASTLPATLPPNAIVPVSAQRTPVSQPAQRTPKQTTPVVTPSKRKPIAKSSIIEVPDTPARERIDTCSMQRQSPPTDHSHFDPSGFFLGSALRDKVATTQPRKRDQESPPTTMSKRSRRLSINRIERKPSFSMSRKNIDEPASNDVGYSRSSTAPPEVERPKPKAAGNMNSIVSLITGAHLQRRTSQEWIQPPEQRAIPKAKCKPKARHRAPKKQAAPSSRAADNQLVPHAKHCRSEKVYAVVRGKARDKLRATECPNCVAFNKEAQLPANTDCGCRHKFTTAPPLTPDGFWDLSFAESTDGCPAIRDGESNSL